MKKTEQPSVYREDDSIRLVGSVKWVLSDSFMNDLWITRLVMAVGMAWVHREFEASGMKWEVAEQKKLLETDSRAFQLTRTASLVPDVTFLGGITDLLFDSSAWECLQPRTEQEQLEVFLAISCCGATGYDLCLRRHRKCPYPNFLAAVGDLSGLRRLRERNICEASEYGENVFNFYGRDGVDGEAAQAEQRLIVAMAGSNTIPIERLNSAAQRRAATCQARYPFLGLVSSFVNAKHFGCIGFARLGFDGAGGVEDPGTPCC